MELKKFKRSCNLKEEIAITDNEETEQRQTK